MLRDQMLNFLQVTVVFLLLTNAASAAAAIAAVRLLNLQANVKRRPTAIERKLNLLLGVTSATCLLSYMLYTVSPETVKLHNTDKLVYTVPFVAYGVFRYLFKVQEGQYDGPDEVLLKDPVFTVNGLLWLLVALAILYIPI